MMKRAMAAKKVATLPALIDQAKEQGVRIVACAMSMEVMGIQQAELDDSVEVGGVADYLASADRGNVNLFI